MTGITFNELLKIRYQNIEEKYNIIKPPIKAMNTNYNLNYVKHFGRLEISSTYMCSLISQMHRFISKLDH